jgi:hypothetical protein
MALHATLISCSGGFAIAISFTCNPNLPLLFSQGFGTLALVPSGTSLLAQLLAMAWYGGIPLLPPGQGLAFHIWHL